MQYPHLPRCQRPWEKIFTLVNDPPPTTLSMIMLLFVYLTVLTRTKCLLILFCTTMVNSGERCFEVPESGDRRQSEQDANELSPAIPNILLQSIVLTILPRKSPNLSKRRTLFSS
jgi:hypothetical protein